MNVQQTPSFFLTSLVVQIQLPFSPEVPGNLETLRWEQLRTRRRVEESETPRLRVALLSPRALTSDTLGARLSLPRFGSLKQRATG
jgi:hypothetical protein